MTEVLKSTGAAMGILDSVAQLRAILSIAMPEGLLGADIAEGTRREIETVGQKYEGMWTQK